MNVYKNIVITGASCGIGKALALYYAKPDVNLCLIARGISAPMKELDQLCRAQGASTFIFHADVVDEQSMRKIAAQFVNSVGVIDLVIANAGIRQVEDENNQDLSIARKVMDVNFFGVLNTISPYLPVFKSQRGGHLAIISSIAAYRGMPNSGIYSASKAALNIWFESLRLRCKLDNIKITVISLSFVNTEMTANLSFWMPGLLSPIQSAQKIAKAIEKGCRTVIIPWQSKIIWSILIVMPNIFYDRFILLAKKYGTKK